MCQEECSYKERVLLEEEEICLYKEGLGMNLQFFFLQRARFQFLARI